jgi:hypothetical protein
VVRIDYDGFEPVQRLLPAAIVDGAPLDPVMAGRLSRLQAREYSLDEVKFDPQLLADVIDEAVFVDQQQVEEAERKHFERAIGQLERFVEDKVLVCRREWAGVVEKVEAAKSRRDSVVGAGAREKIEAEILWLAERLESLDERIAALESREDEVYRRWRDQYHKRRYQTPSVTRLFQATFRITSAETSC